MTIANFKIAVLIALTTPLANAQTAATLNQVRKIYVAPMRNQPLYQELIDTIRHNKDLRLSSEAQSDAVLQGSGDLWIRAYHSLSPRARANDVYAEAIYSGYLSAVVKGKDGEILWSYFANPKRASLGRDLKRNLATQLVDKLTDAIAQPPEKITAPSGVLDKPMNLRGAGATFPFPIYQEWFSSFHNKNRWALFGYDAIGSEKGMQQLAAGNLDFAGTDEIPADKKSGVSFQNFPTVAGAIVLIYNLPDFDGDLRFSPSVLSSILSGRIKQWSDPALKSLNRGAALPDKPIRVVHRSEGSGTTYALTDYISKADRNWANSLGTGFQISWPAGVGAEGNEGVAKLVQDTPFSVGYVEFIYAFRRRLDFASIQNSAGQFVQADLSSISEAAMSSAKSAQLDDALSFSNAPGANSYPITSLSWLMIPTHRDTSAKSEALRQFLEWMLIAGQRQCMALGYVPLPESVVAAARARISNIQ
jgi:phosphate transport system substrate-binding protein